MFSRRTAKLFPSPLLLNMEFINFFLFFNICVTLMIPWLHIYALKCSLISHALSIFIEMTIFMSEVLITVHPKKENEIMVQYPVFH